MSSIAKIGYWNIQGVRELKKISESLNHDHEIDKSLN